MGLRALATFTGAGNDQVPFELSNPTKGPSVSAAHAACADSCTTANNDHSITSSARVSSLA